MPRDASQGDSSAAAGERTKAAFASRCSLLSPVGPSRSRRNRIWNVKLRRITFIKLMRRKTEAKAAEIQIARTGAEAWCITDSILQTSSTMVNVLLSKAYVIPAKAYRHSQISDLGDLRTGRTQERRMKEVWTRCAPSLVYRRQLVRERAAPTA